MIILSFFLIALNGFFVAAEFGLVKLRQTRVKTLAKNNGIRGKFLLKVHKKLDTYLSACQLGITLSSLALGWIGEPAFAAITEPILSFFGVENPKLIHGVSFALAFTTISFLHIVIGELAPKSFALRKPERTSLWLAIPLHVFFMIMYPFIKILNTSSDFVLRIFGLTPSKHQNDGHYSADELKLILKGPATEAGKFNKDEWNILAHALDFSDLEVSDLMRPLNEAACLQRNLSNEDNIKTILTHRFSRYPIISDNGTIEKIIHIKKLFPEMIKDSINIDFEKFSTPIFLAPPTMPALELFRRFKNGAPHFAVIGYKDQKPLGFITLDNLLGALVGEIRDEFKCTTNDWTKLDDGSLIGKGSLPLFTLERALSIEIDEDADSVYGLITRKLDRIPTEGELIEFNNFDISIKKMNGPIIVLMRVFPKNEQDTQEKNNSQNQETVENDK